MFRPIMTSLAFNQQHAFLPFSYNFSIEEIGEIKKFLPKNLFYFQGIDAEDSKITKENEELLQKCKLKVKAVKGVSTENDNQIQYLPKQQVKVVEWHRKSMSLQIPYSSKSADALVEQSINSHLSYYFDNFMHLKNALTEELYSLQDLKVVHLSADQLSTETDIVFTQWNVEPQATDDKAKTIRIDLPVVICLNLNEEYQLIKIKQIIKRDLIASIFILLKHNFNTRVIAHGQNTKQFVCLHSYCVEQTALQEEEKLKKILDQRKKIAIENEETKAAAKNESRPLLVVLVLFIMIYLGLKLFPIQGPDQNKYISHQPKPKSPVNSEDLPEQLF